MNFRSPVVVTALLLMFGCALLRLAENFHPTFLPGATPCVALAFVAAAYLPHRWSWLLGVGSVLLTELFFLRWNFLSEGHWFSATTLVFVGFYIAMGIWGTRLARQPSLAVLFGGPILGSIFFYLLANTLSWAASAGSPLYAYPQNFAGWVQANTTGWPAYAATTPTWIFLRNAIAADVIATAVLIAIFDPARLRLTLASKSLARG